MRPLWKTLLGAGTVAPILAIFGLACFIGYQIIVDDISRGSPMTDPITGLLDAPFDATDLMIFGAIVLGVALLELGLTVVFAVHAARDPRLRGAGVVLWILGFFLAGPLAFPTYFALYVLREPTPKRDPDLGHAPIAA